MYLYLVTPTDGSELSVFAESFDRAVELFTVWWLTHREGLLPDFEVKQRNPAWPGLDTKLLGEALSRDTAGIGLFDPKTGWRIVSPTHVEEQA